MDALTKISTFFRRWNDREIDAWFRKVHAQAVESTSVSLSDVEQRSGYPAHAHIEELQERLSSIERKLHQPTALEARLEAVERRQRVAISPEAYEPRPVLPTLRAIEEGMDKAYGELYAYDSATGITIVAGGTFYPWAASTAGPMNGASGAAGAITIKRSGAYLVVFSASVTASSNQTIHAAVHVNGVRQDSLTAEKTAAVSSTEDIERTGLLRLKRDDVLTLRFTATNNGTTITPVHVTFTVVQI